MANISQQDKKYELLLPIPPKFKQATTHDKLKKDQHSIKTFTLLSIPT